MRTTALHALALFGASLFATAAQSYDVTQEGYDAEKSYNNTAETIINGANVNRLRRLFKVKLPVGVDSSPVYLQGIDTVKGSKMDVLFLTTVEGQILAINAHTGATIWTKQFKETCQLYVGGCQTTSSPAIWNRALVFTYGLDGMIHKLAVGTGAESKHSGFPKPVTLKPTIERVAGGLTIARDQHRTVRIYAATSSAGDSGDYQGHVVAYNLRTGEQGVFNVLCSDQQKLLGLNECPWTGGGVWATGGVRYSPDDNRIYVATGNGLFNPDPAGAGYWGDSLLGLDPSLEKVVSSFTPPNYVDRMLHDKDLGASGPMIVAARNGSGVSHLALQAGKFGGIKVIDRDHGSVGSVGGARVIRNPGGDAEVGAPFARWTNPTDHSLWVFFSDDHAISGFELVPRAKSTALALRWTRTAASTSEWNTLYAAPPMLANNVLFQQRGGVIEALDPTTGNLWWSDATLKRVHRNGPILANGTLYTVDLGNDVAYPSLFAWSLH